MGISLHFTGTLMDRKKAPVLASSDRTGVSPFVSCFKIPKKKLPPTDAGCIQMQSPLSRLSDVECHKAQWDKFSANGRRLQGFGALKSNSASFCSKNKPKVRSHSMLVLTDVPKAELAKDSVRKESQDGKAETTSTRRDMVPSVSEQKHCLPRFQSSAPRLKLSIRPKRASDTLCQNENLQRGIISCQHRRFSVGHKEAAHPATGGNMVSEDRRKRASPEGAIGSEDRAVLSPKSPKCWKPSEECFTGSKERCNNRANFQRNTGCQRDEEPLSASHVLKAQGLSGRNVEEALKNSLQDCSGFSQKEDLHSYPRADQQKKPFVPGTWHSLKGGGIQKSVPTKVGHCSSQAKKVTEPIVLSSDEEEGEEGCLSAMPSVYSKGSRRHSDLKTAQTNSALIEAADGLPLHCNVSSVLEVPFSAVYLGALKGTASGSVMIQEECIIIPVKGVSFALVSSELLQYGLWDNRSLLFLRVSDGQARLLHKELLSINNTELSCQASSCVLLTLLEPLDSLQSARLASLMDFIALRSGRKELALPLSLTSGLAFIHSSPLLAGLKGKMQSVDASEGSLGVSKCHSTRSSAVCLRSGISGSHGEQGLSCRLVLFPPPPAKGGIAVTAEDLECLNSGEFLNDVIIDFYLKYLMLEKAQKAVTARVHVFSSFFYKQLTRRDNSDEEVPGVSAKHRRHQRVKTWTRHVDIFEKDYLFVPVNQESHWYLVVICFPGLEGPVYDKWSKPFRQGAGDWLGANGSLQSATNLPECTELGCNKQTICKRPCILLMDSLKLPLHKQIFNLLCEYLQVEWEVRKGTPRNFSPEQMKGCYCRVPLQDNSSDCGLYLLQYAETFLQNPVVHFDLPLNLEHWFPRQQVRRKREEVRELVLQLYKKQAGGSDLGSR